MALAFQRNQLGMKVTGTTVTIPNNPKARLMYYLNCMATVRSVPGSPMRSKVKCTAVMYACKYNPKDWKFVGYCRFISQIIYKIAYALYTININISLAVHLCPNARASEAFV